jgi:hypothetical protein
MELGRPIFVAESLPEVHLRHQAESTDHPETLHVFVINHIIFAASVTTTQRNASTGLAPLSLIVAGAGRSGSRSVTGSSTANGEEYRLPQCELYHGATAGRDRRPQDMAAPL